MNTIERLCWIPIALKEIPSRSVLQLVKESGFLEKHGALTVETVTAVLRANPDLANHWLTYSADKRSDSGWYFRTSLLKPGRIYEVGHYPDGNIARFADKLEACGHYIVQEIATITGSAT
jgi:hypothetical protein